MRGPFVLDNSIIVLGYNYLSNFGFRIPSESSAYGRGSNMSEVRYLERDINSSMHESVTCCCIISAVECNGIEKHECSAV